MAVLLIRPEVDAVEQVLSGVAAYALSQAPVTAAQSLTRPLTRATVDQAITAGTSPVHILYFGHARRTQLGDPATLVDQASFPNLQGSVVLALACSASDQLGPDAVRNGARAWIGFTRPIPVPLTPQLAPNLEPFRVAAIATLNGDQAGDVEKQTRDAFEALADTTLNASTANYQQAVVNSLVQRGLASTFRADGDRTATI